eukprot:291802-Prorocentrum_minimum.AAC.1
MMTKSHSLPSRTQARALPEEVMCAGTAYVTEYLRATQLARPMTSPVSSVKGTTTGWRQGEGRTEGGSLSGEGNAESSGGDVGCDARLGPSRNGASASSNFVLGFSEWASNLRDNLWEECTTPEKEPPHSLADSSPDTSKQG